MIFGFSAFFAIFLQLFAIFFATIIPGLLWNFNVFAGNCFLNEILVSNLELEFSKPGQGVELSRLTRRSRLQTHPFSD